MDIKGLSDFQAAAEAKGLIFRRLIADGQIHRCQTVDKQKRNNGWYVVRETLGYISGAYGNWATGEKHAWVNKEKNLLTPDQIAAIRREREEYKIALERLREEAASRAQDELDDLPPADPSHPYLITKGVRPHAALQKGDLLVIPLWNEDGEVTTYQTIALDGAKRLLKDGAKQGSYHTIGLEIPTLICEGWATGASLHEATGETVAVAIDAGNIRSILRLFPDAIVAGDNDDAGREAVPQGAKAVFPPRHKDWNDMHAAEGLQAVAQCFLPHGPEQDAEPHPEPPQAATEAPEAIWPDGAVAGKPAPKNVLYYVRASDLQTNLESADFVQELLEDGKISVIYGESNCGKTFWTTNLAYHVAAGREWNGRRVEQGGIVYLALEGAGGLNNRMNALKKRYAAMPDNFLIVPCAVNLMDAEADLPAFIGLVRAAIAEVGSVRWVVVDTLARAMAGADENSGQDMSRLVAAADLIRASTGAHISFVHHSGKDKARGARGHSSLRAAVDTEIEISREPDALFSNVSVVKQRDLAMIEDMQFILQQVVLGENRHGEAVTSCIVEPWDAPAADKKANEMTPAHAFIFEVIKRLAAVTPKVAYDTLRDELDACGFREMYTKKGEPKEVKSMTYNARVSLRNRNLIDFDGDQIWLI